MANTCRSCGAGVTFARHHVTGKAQPLEVDPEGRWRIEGGIYLPATDATSPYARYTSHFATCPQARSHRKTTTGGTA